MGKAYYIENGTVRDVRKIYVGVNNKARIIRKGYVGVNGVARLIFGLDMVPIPTIAGTYTYDGTEQTANIVNYNENFMTRTGIYKATSAGTYQVTFTLTHEDSAWADGSSEPITLSWTIEKATLIKPTISGTYTYNGQTQTLVLNGYDSNTMTKSGPSTEVNAGIYEIRISLNDSNNYKWYDDNRTTITLYWVVAKAVWPTTPYLSTSRYAYNGNYITPTVVNFDSTKMEKQGADSAKYPGSYTVYVVLTDSNYIFSNGYDMVALEWVIEQGRGTISPSTDSYSGYVSDDDWMFLRTFTTNIANSSVSIQITGEGGLAVNYDRTGDYKVNVYIKRTFDSGERDGTIRVTVADPEGLFSSATAVVSYNVYNYS